MSEFLKRSEQRLEKMRRVLAEVLGTGEEYERGVEIAEEALASARDEAIKLAAVRPASVGDPILKSFFDPPMGDEETVIEQLPSRPPSPWFDSPLARKAVAVEDPHVGALKKLTGTTSQANAADVVLLSKTLDPISMHETNAAMVDFHVDLNEPREPLAKSATNW